MILTKDQLLAGSDREVKLVPLSDGDVCVRSLSGRELLSYDEEIKAAVGSDERLLAVKLSWIVGDESGARTMSAEEGLKLLEGRSGKSITKLIEAGDKLNGWGDDVKGN